MNKILKLVLLGLLVVVSGTALSSVVVSADNGDIYTDEEYTYGEYSYEYDQQTKEAMLIAVYVAEDKLDFIVPEKVTINNELYTVTKIGSPDAQPLIGSSEILSFQLPNTIKEIGEGCFYDVTFPETIILPNSLEKIGLRAFALNKGLKHLTIPASVKTISEEAFHSSTLENVIFSEGLIDIGASAFAYNNIKGAVILPESVQTVASFTFAGNPALTSVKLPSSFTSVPDGLFAATGVSNLDFLKSQPNIKKIGKYVFKFNAFNGLPTILTVPDTIEIIDEGAFSGFQQAGVNWSTIEEINLSNHVNHVGAMMFYDQPLNYINVPQNQAAELKEVLNATAMEGVREATIIRDGHQGYAAGTLADYQVSEGQNLTFQAFSENKYQLNTTTLTWEVYKPQVQWYKDGQLLEASTTDTLALSNIKATDAGTYYAVVDGKRLSDIHVAVGEEKSLITVRYVDKNGTELHPTQTVTGSIGASYDVSTPAYLLIIDGYVIDESNMPTTAQGVFTNQSQTVTFVYKKVPAGATVPKQDNPSKKPNVDQNLPLATSSDSANVQKIESTNVFPQTGVKQRNMRLDLLIGGLFLAAASALLRIRKNI